MTELIRIPLDERIQSARDGRTRQPEYLPALVQQWAKMPIKAYFGDCEQELERLYAILNLAPDENPAYQAVAGRIFDLKYITSGGMDVEATELLAAPVRAKWEKYRRGTGNG